MKSTGWELSAGLYPGVLIGIRSYQEEKFTEHVFYLPFLSHPDPSVKRRSGLLPPTFNYSKNLVAGFSIQSFCCLTASTSERALYLAGSDIE